MPNLFDWIWAAGTGAAVTAMILLIFRGWRAAGLRWAPAAVALAFVAACAVLGRIRRPPPIMSEDWLPYLAVALGVIGLVDALWRAPALLRWLAAAAVAAGVAFFVFRPFAKGAWESQNATVWMAMIAAAILAAMGSSDELERRSPAGPLIMAMVSAATGVIAALSGYLSIGPLAAALAGACGTVMIFQLLTTHGRGVATVATPLLVAILFLVFVAANLTAANLGLCLSALFLPHVVVPFTRTRPKLRATLQIAAALIPLAVALVLAKQAFDAASQELGMYG